MTFVNTNQHNEEGKLLVCEMPHFQDEVRVTIEHQWDDREVAPHP